MFKCIKLVICHSLRMKLSPCTLGDTWSLSPEKEEEKFWSTFCGRIGGCFSSGSASGTLLSCLVLGSTVSICHGLGLSLYLRPGSLLGGDAGNLLFWSRLHSLKAVSGGLVGLQLWHSSRRPGSVFSVVSANRKAFLGIL